MALVGPARRRDTTAADLATKVASQQFHAHRREHATIVLQEWFLNVLQRWPPGSYQETPELDDDFGTQV